MKTMGLRRLAIVRDPGAPELDESAVREASLHAFELYEEAYRFDTLEAALWDSSFAAGFTRRTGFRRNKARFSPSELAEEALRRRPDTVDFVFGNEEHGLTTDELRLCTVVGTIPTDADFPSLNLSHAVQIACYELLRACTEEPRGKAADGETGGGDGDAVGQTAASSSGPGTGESGAYRRAADLEHVSNAVSAMADNLEAVGLFKLGDRELNEQFFAEWIMRAAMTRGEVNRLRRIVQKIRYIKRDR
jgi:tRNA/rRNA methyltransferase